MVASLGSDVETICAAARAGLIRSRTLDNYRIRSGVDGAEEAVVAHEATLITQGFEGEARQIRLAQAALTDLLQRTSHVDWPAQSHRFYVAFPAPGRIDEGDLLIADPGARSALAERIAERSEFTDLDGLAFSAKADSILQRAATLARWPAEISLAFSSCEGNVAALRAIEAAMSDLHAGSTQVAVVLAVDSLLDESTLDWLQTCGRLKCDAAPAGLRPGESAVALALCSRSSAVPPDAAAEIQAIAFSDESRSLYSGSAPAGQALAEVIDRLWRERPQGTPWIVCDQNGENYRAADWGFAAVRLRALHDAFASPVLWYPAASVGDTASASCLVGVCFALRAWKRGYAAAGAALVTACNDDGGRGALLLTTSDYSR